MNGRSETPERTRAPTVDRRLAQTASWVLTLGAVFGSLLVVPGGLTYYFVVHGPPEDGPEMLAVGLVSMLPGVLLGTTALWVMAHD